MDKTNYSVARVQTYTRASIQKAERHNERKNKSYSNMNVDLTQTSNNVYYKRCKKTYNQRLKEMIENGYLSLRGLKDNAKVFDEIIFDINSDYFEQNGGYEFAKEFYEKAFNFAEKEMGAENILSAVMHADELNTALTEEYKKPIYHYHLHVIAIPVVEKEIKWTKRCKDKALIGTTKEIINQVTDLQGNPLYNEKGKAILIKSYSLLQDRFFEYMSNSGYKGFIRGIKGSTTKHLTDLEFKIKKEKENLDKITNKVNEKQNNLENIMQYDKKLEDVSSLGKQKKFSKKVELEQKDYENLVNYAKKGIVADKEIYERDVRISNLKSTINKLQEKYDDIVKKTKDFFHAIKLAPQKVTDLFKSLFDKEKQEELERQKLEQEEKEKARLEKP